MTTKYQVFQVRKFTKHRYYYMEKIIEVNQSKSVVQRHDGLMNFDDLQRCEIKHFINFGFLLPSLVMNRGVFSDLSL